MKTFTKVLLAHLLRMKSEVLDIILLQQLMGMILKYHYLKKLSASQISMISTLLFTID